MVAKPDAAYFSAAITVFGQRIRDFQACGNVCKDISLKPGARAHV